MTTEVDKQKNSQPQLVKLDKALKLAEQWVNNMSKSSVNTKPTAPELEGRPARLGIGATVPRESRVVRSNDPVERKLLGKLNAEKRKETKKDEDMKPSSRAINEDEDSEDEESESKTKVFSKKRPLNMSSPLQEKKKHK